MSSLYPVSCFSVAFVTGNDNIAPVHPDPHVPARNEERIAMMAESAAVLAVDPAPLAHRDSAGKFHVPVGE
jgi:hypothetical protein